MRASVIQWYSKAVVMLRHDPEASEALASTFKKSYKALLRVGRLGRHTCICGCRRSCACIRTGVDAMSEYIRRCLYVT
jgi:hypothetical protein